MLPSIVRKYGKSVARLIGPIDRVFAERDRLREEAGRLRAGRDPLDQATNQDAPQFMPPGHFYSPIASLADVSGMSLPVITAFTPGIASAAVVAIETMRACA